MQSPKNKKSEKRTQTEGKQPSKREELLFAAFSVLVALVSIGFFLLLLGKPGQPSQTSPRDNINSLMVYLSNIQKSQQEKSSLGDVKIVFMKSMSARDKNAHEATRFSGDDPIMMKVTFVNPKDKKILTVDIYHKGQNGEQKVRTVSLPAYQKGDRYLAITQTAKNMEKGQYVVKLAIGDIPLFEKNFIIE